MISRTDLKRCLLLTTALFLMVAPAPGAHDIAGVTAGTAGVAGPGTGR